MTRSGLQLRHLVRALGWAAQHSLMSHRDNWAKTTSYNKNVKVYIGAPGSAEAAGTGYVSSSTLAQYVSDAQSKYSSFGGVMMWDADTAYS